MTRPNYNKLSKVKLTLTIKYIFQMKVDYI